MPICLEPNTCKWTRIEGTRAW